MPAEYTPAQSAVLEYLIKHLGAYQRPPTRLEIAQRFGWSSPNAAEDHLKALARKGAIVLHGDARGIFVRGMTFVRATEAA